MLSEVKPWDTVAQGYSETTMKLFQCYADKALELVGINDQDSVADIACGPGTLALTAAQTARAVSALDFSENMLAILKDTISENGITNIDVHHGDGQALPYDNNTFDAAFSMFGLMFFPDRSKGYAEILRTLKPGGAAVISSWAPVCESSAMKIMFGALQAMNPDIPDPQTDVESLENPDFFQSELETAGFKEIKIHPVSGDIQINNIERFWQDMVKGSAPFAMMKKKLTEEQWEQKQRIALDYLHNTVELNSTLSSIALLAFARK